VLFLAVTAFVLYNVKESGQRRDKLLSDMVATCQQPKNPAQ